MLKFWRVHKLKINDNIENPRWKQIPCSCDHSSVLTEFPIKDCIHCKCELSENSIPKNDFIVKSADENGNPVDVTVSEITLNRCDKYNQCIGWAFRC